MLINTPESLPHANVRYPDFTDDVPRQLLYYPFWDAKAASERWVHYAANNFGIPDFTDSGSGSIYFDRPAQAQIALITGEQPVGENYFVPQGGKLYFSNLLSQAFVALAANRKSLTYKIEALETETLAADFSFASPPTGRLILDVTIDDIAGDDFARSVSPLQTEGYCVYRCVADTYGLTATQVNTGTASASGSLTVRLPVSTLTPYPFQTNDRPLHERIA